jgi:hypothetical protein
VKWFSLRTYRLAFAGVLLALPYKARFGRSVKRLAFRTNRLTFAGLRHGVPIRHEVIKATRITRVIAASGLLVKLFLRSDKRTVFDLGQIQDRGARTIVNAYSVFAKYEPVFVERRITAAARSTPMSEYVQT